MPVYCTRCGKVNKADAKSCLECGEVLESSAGTLHTQPALLDNRYEIMSMVKSGAMGCVYRARDTRLDTVVAIKQMLCSFPGGQDAEYTETRFKEEAKILSTLHHSGLPKVMDYFTATEVSSGKTSHYLVMTFIEGKDLETIIQERGQKPFPVDEVVDYSNQILDILQYLHTQNPPIIYRDLNPRNIMVQNGKIFLVDFGIARLFTPQKKGTAIGTPGYAAPEQYKGDSEPRSDLYSLGVIMHYLLTGKNPEDSSNKLFTFEEVRKLNASVPEHMATVITGLLDIIPDKRPSGAEQVKSMVKTPAALRKKTAMPLPAPPGRAPTPATPVNKSKGIGLALASLAFIMMIVLAFHYAFHKTQNYADIFVAIDRGDLPAVRNFVIKNPGIISSTKEITEIIDHEREITIEFTPLHYTAYEGRRKIAEFLLTEGVHVDTRDKLGDTPLHFAGRKDMAELLISKGALVNARDDLGLTPLHWASWYGHRDVAEFLISKGADVNARDVLGFTPLCWASMEGHRDVAELLISKGADVNAIDHLGFTSLRWASWFGHKDIAEFLLLKGAKGEIEDAASQESGFMRRPPYDAERLRHVSKLLMDSKEYARAIDVENAAQKIHETAEGYYTIGLCYHNLRDDEKAITNLQSAIKKDGAYYPPFKLIGDICRQKKEFSQAITSYRTAYKLKPDENGLIYDMALVAYEMGDYHTAEVCLKSYLALETDSAKKAEALRLYKVVKAR